LSARRRSLLLSAAFLGLAVLLTTTRPAHAQPGRKPSAPTPPPSAGVHVTNGNWVLTPDQFRAALGQGGGELDPKLLELLRERMKKQFPQLNDRQREEWLKFAQQHPDFRKAVKDAEEKWKSGEKRGQPPDFGKMLKNLPQGNWPKAGDPMGGPPAVPPSPPTGGGDPTVTPPRPPTLPTPPDTDPGGNAANPPVAPKGGAAQPPVQLDPGRPPNVVLPKKSDPPPDPPQTPPENTLPFDLPPEDPEQAAKRKAMQVLGATWERNVGPLEETPAVKNALLELVEGAGDLKGPDGESFWDALTKDTGSGASLADWLDDVATDGGDWKLPSFEMPSFRLGRMPGPDPGGGSNSSSGSWWSRRGSSGSEGGFGIPGLEGSWLPVILLAAILLGALVAWRFWYLRDDKAVPVYELGGLGPWPVDPRRIATREQLVQAFEYLSVLICGPTARTWTHHTIAATLADLAATHSETAMILARLYELARYAPLDEPLTAAEIAEARRLVCRLAGVSHE
jgi:hypothetical protein